MNDQIQQSKNSVKAIRIYPVKSLKGIDLNSSKLCEEGLEYDRKFMLVDENGRFLSQREIPQLACFECNISNNELSVSYKGDTIKIPLSEPKGNLRNVSVWDSNFQAARMDAVFNNWFSNALGKNVELVTLSSSSIRIKKIVKPPYQTSVSFADGYPVLILGTASMDKLNDKLEIPIDFDRFRPNVVINTEVPHEEDIWENISIGEVQLKIVKPCARCAIPTIDQSTGIKGVEPMKTLSTYRIKDKQVMFGVNAISIKTGTLSINDNINLL